MVAVLSQAPPGANDSGPGMSPQQAAEGPHQAGPATIDQKAFATLQARAALLGCTLLRSRDDKGCEVYLIARDVLCKELDGAESIDAWLKRLGGPSA